MVARSARSYWCCDGIAIFVSNGSASVTGIATVRALGGFITNGNANVNALATVDIIGDIIGYEWEDVVPSHDMES